MKFTHAGAHALLAPIPQVFGEVIKLAGPNRACFSAVLSDCYKDLPLHTGFTVLLMELLD